MKRCDFFAFRIGRRVVEIYEISGISSSGNRRERQEWRKGRYRGGWSWSRKRLHFNQRSRGGRCDTGQLFLGEFRITSQFFFLGTWDEFNKMPRLKKELRKQYDNPSRV